MDAHQVAVASVAAQTRQLYEEKIPFRIYHGSTNSTCRSQRRRDNTVDISKLDRVLHVNRHTKTAVVEPNVPMAVLLESTIKDGLVPLVVLEFPGITAGGAFCGTSGESSSFRYGAFDSTVNWIEIVLPTGEITQASKKRKPDLFWGAASGFGTLGIVTLLEVQLRDAQKYVQLTYHHALSVSEAVDTLQEETAKDTNEYVDGIAFNPKSIIICTGHMVNELPDGMRSRHFTRSWDPWFYVHVERIRKRMHRGSANITEFVSLADYLFRYDRGGFWTAKYAFKYFITQFNRITRFILNPFMHTRVMYRAMHKSGLSDYYMLQDVGVPYDKAGDFTSWLDSNLNVYPIWLCPLRLRRDSPQSHYGLHAELANPNTPDLLNFGVWGPLSFDRRKAVRQNRALEQKVHQLGGKKWLYAHAYYTEEEFWANYDRKSYDALRERYAATYLPSVYDKVKVDVDAEEAATRASWTAWLLAVFWSIWPLRGLYGVYTAVVGGDYLLQKSNGNSSGALKAE